MLSLDKKPHFTILHESLTLFIHIFLNKRLITKLFKKTAYSLRLKTELLCVFFPHPVLGKILLTTIEAIS